ncbi:serine/threonine protein kinase [Telmatocola sphagniphila]|uniref:Serine/threonine protein kinase n=1 Tax=Telmatocola sphagniphila TaxID=1123043 RepID=A0A8E6BBE6_9BACT|nr:serine/threonine-protein kinase [Telmatocola sphagniphila]QVL33845.1 serine/threonine protein kinase [Telmatocola sphagniphila]
MQIWNPRANELFLKALLVDNAQMRGRFLDAECAENIQLRKQVESLLEASELAGDFLEEPAAPTFVPKILHQHSASQFTDPGIESGTVVAGRYRLVDEIGGGGMGSVWAALQLEPIKRKVAVKLIKPGLDSKGLLARFEAERQALALMDHPNIAKVLDGGVTSSGRPFLVMELVLGKSITQYCDEHNLPPRERLALLIPVCEAVQHAHQKGIIHRDLKPTNVLVTEQEGKPVPKVIDFGVAKAVGQDLTESTLVTGLGTVIGTLEYMSPEQANLDSLDIDSRADIYSLGVLIYELLTGTTPLTRQRIKKTTLLDNLRLIREEDPPRPSLRLMEPGESSPAKLDYRLVAAAKWSRELHGELDSIVMKALEKDRTRRYASANCLARDLERYLNDEPVEACPPSRAYRFRKMARRHKALLSAVAAICLLLIAGITVSTILAFRASRANERAREMAKAEAGQRERAEAKGREVSAVLHFLENNVLAAGRPVADNGLGNEVTLRRAIDSAVPEIGVAFKDQPLIEASVRTVIGMSYRRLGEPALAIPQLKRACSLYTDVLGAESEKALFATKTLGEAYQESGSWNQAQELYEDVLQRMREHLGPHHRDTLWSMNNLAGIYSLRGQHKEAIALHIETQLLMKEHLGEFDLTTIGQRHNLGLVYQAARQMDLAMPILEETARSTQEQFPKHPNVLFFKDNLASAYEDAGRLERAVALREELLPLETDQLGVSHPLRLRGMRRLMETYQRTKQLDKAVEVGEKLYTAYRTKFSFESAEVRWCVGFLVECNIASGHRDRAIGVLERFYDGLIILGSTGKLDLNDLAASIVRQLVNLCEDCGRTNEAAKWRRELELRKKTMP